MFYSLLRKALCSLILGLPIIANSAIIDFGLYTRDTASGLDWLDLTETHQLSYQQVSQQMGPGGAYEGWRYATRVELFDLLSNMGLTISDPVNAYSNIYPFYSGVQLEQRMLAEAAIGLLGATTFSGVNTPATSGILGDIHTYPNSTVITHPIAVITVNVVALPGIYLREIDSSPLDGSYLVRAVPLPASAWLFTSGLLALLYQKQRQDKLST